MQRTTSALSCLLAVVARENPSALKLATILFNVQPCESCGYVHTHCKCKENQTANEVK